MLDEIEMLGPITAEGMEDHEPEAKKIHQEPTILSANRLRRDMNKLNKAVKDKRKGKEEPDRKKKMMKERKQEEEWEKEVEGARWRRRTLEPGSKLQDAKRNLQ